MACRDYRKILCKNHDNIILLIIKGDFMLARGVSVILLCCLFVVGISEEVHATDDNLLNMIEVRSDDGWTNEVHQMVANLDRVDARILRHANASGVRIILMDMPLTDLPEFSHLSGSVPSGWSETGLTWDEVPGAGGIITAARTGYSRPGNGHSVVNLELHEFAHAVDDFTAGFKISNSEEFRQIHSRENSALFYDHVVPDYFNMVNEYFAEAFAMYYYNDSTRSKLQSRAPDTYQFIATLANRLVSVDQVTGNSVTLSFTPLGDAANYNIYRDNALVETVSAGDGRFTDTGLDVSSTYSYFIRAVDGAGQEYLTSYYRNVTTQDEPDPVSETEDTVGDEPIDDEEVEVIEEEVVEEVVEEEVPETVEPEVDETEVELEAEVDVTEPETIVEENEDREIPEFTEVTIEESTDETESDNQEQELEDETLETSTQQEQLRGESSYPAWVYILSGLLGIIITGGALLFISRRV